MRNIFTAFFILFLFNLLTAESIKVPGDFSSIQDAIDNSADGDTILVEPGTYQENIEVRNKSFVLTSNFIFSKSESDVMNTVIDGDNGDYVFRIYESDKAPLSIIGITIQNADDGIMPNAKFNIMNCIVTKCTDGIDYESGSGGICKDNTFEYNDDDGIDLDEDVDILIENNKIINNDDDGIEIRLHKYSGALLNYEIKNNIISGNDEDGIQIIDYPDVSDRILKIYNNLIFNNSMSGIGLMSDGNTVENYEGAPIEEPIEIINNTFSDNEYGITGGANLIAKNNIIINCAKTAYKNVSEASLITYTCLWNNGQDFSNSNYENNTIENINPAFSDKQDFILAENSECIDAGDPDSEYDDPNAQNGSGSALWPSKGTTRNDLGAYGGPYADDWDTKVITKINDEKAGQLLPLNNSLFQNYPNPFNPSTTISYKIKENTTVNVRVFDSNGKVVSELVNKIQQPGTYSEFFNATGLSSGVYYFSISTGNGFSQTRKMVLLR
ncbi:MAG: right-handed parallel beta-helix repeat-containing protein [Calditrichae bacterium]|nr:right-handed parallel beta-helix repeat-containing protein [Calditrichota bacterium]MCB9058944.1 right-handed parallel beta-helix repeat-containing protein [Calditrichia bacterium]